MEEHKSESNKCFHGNYWQTFLADKFPVKRSVLCSDLSIDALNWVVSISTHFFFFFWNRLQSRRLVGTRTSCTAHRQCGATSGFGSCWLGFSTAPIGLAAKSGVETLRVCHSAWFPASHQSPSHLWRYSSMAIFTACLACICLCDKPQFAMKTCYLKCSIAVKFLHVCTLALISLGLIG